eukprot:scaffold107079_cov72-Phaeocystis_antarctica.AAC.4
MMIASVMPRNLLGRATSASSAAGVMAAGVMAARDSGVARAVSGEWDCAGAACAVRRRGATRGRHS